jgi:hypothetical protein
MTGTQRAAGVSDLHWGQVVVATGAAFQLARRERVLERDIFRFGTATSGPLLCRSGLVLGQGREGRPSGVDQVVLVVRVLRERLAALGAQPGAVGPAHRLERQCRNHRVPEQRFEVDQTVLDSRLLGCVLVPHLVVVGVALGVDEQLLEGPVDRVGSRGPGTARRRRSPCHGPEPVTSTPSTTDSRRRSRVRGWPCSTRMTTVPKSLGAPTSRVSSLIVPGRRPTSLVSSTISDRGSSRVMSLGCCRCGSATPSRTQTEGQGLPVTAPAPKPDAVRPPEVPRHGLRIIADSRYCCTDPRIRGRCHLDPASAPSTAPATCGGQRLGVGGGDVVPGPVHRDVADDDGTLPTGADPRGEVEQRDIRTCLSIGCRASSDERHGILLHRQPAARDRRLRREGAAPELSRGCGPHRCRGRPARAGCPRRRRRAHPDP